MPTYDYECEKCEHQFEVIHTMSEKYKNGCPKCGNKKVKKVFNVAPQVNMGEHTISPVKKRYVR